MAITYDKRNKCFRFQFNRAIQGRRYRLSKLLPRGWSQAEADAFDRQECARLYAVATGIQRRDPLIEEAIVLYLQDKTHLKSYKKTTENLAAVTWAYKGKPMSELANVAKAIREEPPEEGKPPRKPATIKNRLALIKAACRWAWKKHGLTDHDPTTRMQMPVVNNARHKYLDRREMLKAVRACKNWETQIAARVAFYTGMRLGELYQVEVDGDVLILPDTKNGERRAIPVHHKIAHLTRFLPLTGPKITIQSAWRKTTRRLGMSVTFHDLRHSTASEMVNNDVDLYAVGAVLGHKDPRSTKRYAHLRAKKLASAVNQIGKKAA